MMADINYINMNLTKHVKTLLEKVLADVALLNQYINCINKGTYGPSNFKTVRLIDTDKFISNLEKFLKYLSREQHLAEPVIIDERGLFQIDPLVLALPSQIESRIKARFLSSGIEQKYIPGYVNNAMKDLYTSALELKNNVRQSPQYDTTQSCIDGIIAVLRKLFEKIEIMLNVLYLFIFETDDKFGIFLFSA